MSENTLLTDQTSPCGRVNRRVFLADCGMGFTGLVLGSMLQRDGILKADAHAAWLPPDGKAAFCTQGQECHLAVHVGWCQSRRVVRSETCHQQICRKDDRRDTTQRLFLIPRTPRRTWLSLWPASTRSS